MSKEKRIYLRLLVVVVAGVLIWGGSLIMTRPSKAVTPIKPFNEYVMEVVESYPTDGSIPYDWSDHKGIRRDLVYRDELFVEGDPQKRTYCSGITFEVFFQAYQAYAKDHGLDSIANMSLEELEEFRLLWYGTGGDRRTIWHALESTGLGYRVYDKSDVEKGDFVQIWRHSGSGHTVVFIDWLKDKNGNIFGFKYWSSNTGKGPSYRTEYFGRSGKSMIDNETYFMKVIDPLEWFERNSSK